MFNNNNSVLVELDPLFLIKTPRLLIKETTIHDTEQFISLYGDPETMKSYADGNIRNPERVNKMIEINIERWKLRIPYSSMSIFDKKSLIFIGNIFVSTYERDDGTGLLGFLIKKELQNRHYGKEAVLAVINNFIPRVLELDYVTKINKILAYCLIHNYPSIKILDAACFERTAIVNKFGGKRYLYERSVENLKLKI